MHTGRGRIKQAFRGGSWRSGAPGWRLDFTYDYDEDAIVALKRLIPPDGREWNPEPEVRLWWISEVFEEEILMLFPDFEAYLRQPQLF